jgi:hypothetical protein
MAESKSVMIEKVVSEVMAGEHADVLRESVRLVVRELMNAEVSRADRRRARRAHSGPRDLAQRLPQPLVARRDAQQRLRASSRGSLRCGAALVYGLLVTRPN